MPSAKLPSHAFISAEGAKPERSILFLHGVFGLGLNWRTFAKAVCERVPSWGAVLVDLRGHGTSQGFEPPHTLASAAADVAELVRSLDVPVAAIAGHSFGGKVTLEFLASNPGVLDHAFVVDSVPGARPEAFVVESTHAVLSFLEGLPATFASREEFANAARAAGFAPPMIDWLAMNVRRGDDGYALRLDLAAIRAMLVDYYHRDLWSAVADSSVRKSLHLIVGGASGHYTDADLDRARAIERTNPRVHLTIVERAGHWVHVDEPAALREVMVRALDDASSAST